MAQSVSLSGRRRFRKLRVRSRVSGTASRPRLSVFPSWRSFSIQAIDDVSEKTIASASLREVSEKDRHNTTEGAREVGKLLSKKCLALGISAGVFDRNGYRYHGRVRAAAEGIREGGITV
ncbi:MAG: 50S ribosomal protein L18 [Candidatus Moraniibacteriota bacterium]|nr:MAG: 50S ribosomal protein L18 [Candidatus Moranbacteria bacterium]